ncbi:MAG: glycosyltransferase [Limnohabitans sp.]|nr:glycosyltransferase [Limnohabitans sp.]
MKEMQVSVVIPTYNGKEKVLRLLNKLCLQTNQDFETIVVIDGSTDGTVEELSKSKWDLQSLQIIAQENKGRAGSRNTGANNASGTILIFIDDDIIPDKTLIQDHLEAQEKNDIVVGILDSYDDGVNPEMLAFSKYKNQQMNAAIFENVAEEMTVPYITANNFSIKKQLFQKLGGFDARLNDAEDFEFAVRCKESGYPIFYTHNCLAYHSLQKNLEESARRSKEYRKGQEILLKYHPHIEQYIPNSINHINILKRPFFYLLSFPFWLRLADKNFFKFLPPKFRFKLYDIMWTGNYYY